MQQPLARLAQRDLLRCYRRSGFSPFVTRQSHAGHWHGARCTHAIPLCDHAGTTQFAWLCREGGGEQICMCQCVRPRAGVWHVLSVTRSRRDKCVVYSGAGDLLFFVSGSDEYDEVARALTHAYRILVAEVSRARRSFGGRTVTAWVLKERSIFQDV